MAAITYNPRALDVLALAIIARAMRDAEAQRTNPTTRAGAIAWLRDIAPDMLDALGFDGKMVKEVRR